MQAEGRARRILILDCDVHQGDGTAFVFRRDPDVFTLSIHGRDNFPLRKERSDLDLPLADGTGDRGYLEALEAGLRVAWAAGPWDLAIYLSGADPFAGDRLGRLALSGEGLAARDRAVLEGCRRRGIPVAVVMGGGYAPDPRAVAELHLQTVRLAVSILDRRAAPEPRPEAPGGDDLATLGTPLL